MANPAQLIAKLDASLAAAGEDIVIRRYTAVTGDPRPKTDKPKRASVRPVRNDEIIGAIDQTGSAVVISPTGLSALLPLRKGDKAVIQGRERNIEFPKPIYVAGTLVRINLLVMG